MRIEDVPPSEALEYFIMAPQWFNAFPPPFEPHFARLAEHVKRLLESADARRGSPQALSPAEAKRAAEEEAEVARQMEEERRRLEQAETAERKPAEAEATNCAVAGRPHQAEAATAAEILEPPQQPPPKKLGWMVAVAALGLVLLIGSVFLYLHGERSSKGRSRSLQDALAGDARTEDGAERK